MLYYRLMKPIFLLLHKMVVRVLLDRSGELKVELFVFGTLDLWQDLDLLCTYCFEILSVLGEIFF